MNKTLITRALPKGGENLSNPKIRKKVHRYLPVPNDFTIKWAEVNSYGGNPAGIAITNKGIICKSPEKKSIKKDKRIASVYQFIPWDYYDPESYKVKALEEGYGFFLGNEQIAEFYNSDLNVFFNNLEKEYKHSVIVNAAIAEELTVGDLEAVAFHAAYGADNMKTGHGIYAEEAGAKLDKLHGEKVAVVGRDNAKNGPDKIVNKVPVQCKYCRTPSNTINACFKRNSRTGEMTFRYFQLDGKTPMMIEVPKDQYEKAVQLFEKRILNGEVPGITNPEAAKAIVRKGKLTYKQTVNLAKAGTIESLTYDIATGIVSCSAIGGISAISVYAITYWQTKDKKKAAKASLIAGLEVFGPAFAGRVIAQQIARSAIPNALIPLSATITSMLNPKTVQYVLNAFRNMAGKKSIYGAAAQKSFAKALRSNVLTQVIIFGVTSIPDTYRVIMRKISVAQFTKNMTSGIAALGGGAAGALAGAKAGAHLPVPGGAKVAGIAGGATGGFVVGFMAKGLGSLIKEDDRYIYSRMINSVICAMSIDYLLSEDEIKALISKLDDEEKDLKALMQRLVKSNNQYSEIEKFMNPIFEEIVKKRSHIAEREEVEMCELMDETMMEMSEEDQGNEM